MWHRVASQCETQPQQGSVISHRHPPKTLEQIPLQELYRPVSEDVLTPVTPPQVPAQQPIEVDDEDMQPTDQPQQSMQPPLIPLPDSPMQDSLPGSPGTTSRSTAALTPPAGIPVQAPGSPMMVCSSGHSALFNTSSHNSGPATATISTASSVHHCAAVDAAFMVAPSLPGTTSNGGGNFSFRGNATLRWK